jgi:hypothetical protein
MHKCCQTGWSPESEGKENVKVLFSNSENFIIAEEIALFPSAGSQNKLFKKQEIIFRGPGQNQLPAEVYPHHSVSLIIPK